MKITIRDLFIYWKWIFRLVWSGHEHDEPAGSSSSYAHEGAADGQTGAHYYYGFKWPRWRGCTKLTIMIMYNSRVPMCSFTGVSLLEFLSFNFLKWVSICMLATQCKTKNVIWLFVCLLVGWLVVFKFTFHSITRSYGYSQHTTKASVVVPAWEETKIVGRSQCWYEPVSHAHNERWFPMNSVGNVTPPKSPSVGMCVWILPHRLPSPQNKRTLFWWYGEWVMLCWW